MIREQYNELRDELNFGEYRKNFNSEIFLYISSGRKKGKLGKIVGIDHGFFDVLPEGDAKTISLNYTKLERIDKDNKPIYENSRDITGRPITGTEVICYSVSSGNSSHALEIGRIIKTNPSGSLTVKPIIRNGKKIAPVTWGRQTRNGVDGSRAIILPLDENLVMTWLLSDFEIYKHDALIED